MKLPGILFCIWITLDSFAQTICTGTVQEAGRADKLDHVFVHNLTNREYVFTNNAGKFSIKASINDILVFALPGYVSDTLFLINLEPRRIYLEIKGIRLNEVKILGESFNPRRDYPEAYILGEWIKAPTGGGLTFSPSRLFGRKGRNARRLKKYLEGERIERQTDALFQSDMVSSIIPLKGMELWNFMRLFRPSLAYLKKTSHQDLLIYINDCYKKWKTLSPEKRTIPKLVEE